MPTHPPKKQLDANCQDLRARLEKAEATLSEILSGDADALFVTGVAGAQLFTLKGADQSYRTLIENMSEGALSLTPVGLVLYANRRFAEMLKTPLEKVIGSEVHNWITPESWQVLRPLLQKNAINNHREELVLAAADGTPVPVYLSVSHLVLDDTDSICMVVTDLREQKRNEAMLAEEKLARAILEQAADVIVICDENGHIMRASKQAQALYGNNPVGQLLEQAFPLRLLDGSVFSAANTIEANRSLSLEARLERDGQKFDFLVSVGHLKGSGNELLGYVVTLIDITERKQNEMKLLESERRFTDLLENVELISVMLDREARITYCNDFLLILTGWQRTEVIGKNWWELFVPPERHELIGDFFSALLDNQPEALHHENDIVTRSGERRLIRWNNSVLRSNTGDVIGTASIGEDITDRKLAENNLRWRTAFFEALVKTSGDGILVVDSQGNKILQNQRMIDLWQMPEDIATNPDDKPQLQYVINQVVDAKQFGDKVHYLYEHPQETSEDEVALKNGSFFLRYSAPVLDSDGHSYGRIWSFQDVTGRKQAEQALRTSEERFRTMFVQAPLGIALIDSTNGRIQEVNTRFAEIAGRSAQEILNFDWVQLTHPDDVPAGLDNMALINAGKTSRFRIEKRFLRPDSQTVWIDMTVAPLKTGDQEKSRNLCMIQDISERKVSEASIKYLNRVLSVLSGINTLIVRANDRKELFREACNIAIGEGGFRMAMLMIVNPSTMLPVTVISAGKGDELLAAIKKVMSSSEEMQKTQVARAIRGKKAVISNDTQKDPRLLFGNLYAEAGIHSMTVLPLIISGEAIGVFALFASEIEFFREDEMKLLTELAGDIAFAVDHIEKQERLIFLAFYDDLTGLANRSLFFDRAEQHIHNAISGGHKLAIGLIDLERFKNINDSLGRPAGDSLLKQMAQWLSQFTGDANLLARIDADHFAFVVPEVKADGNLTKLVENVMANFLVHPFHLKDSTFRIGIKVGISVFPDDGADINTLFNKAEAALKKAKTDGDRYLFYSQKMSAFVADKLALENQLREAIDKEEFVLHYQPKVNLVSGKVTSAEALIRWHDPRTGLVPPAMFIPILEETGLINEVGRWALHKAMEDCLRWRSAGLPAVRIAVNVSSLQLRNTNFMNEIKRVIALDPHASAGLELEITESLIMKDVDQNIATLQEIRDLGVTIAIDDFGTGFSSLSYLAKLPVDTLKIDRSFVIEMDTAQGLALVSTIIILAHALKLKVVAEGVETEKQSRQLLSLNCDEMQGFLFSKPVPTEIFEAKFLLPVSGI